MGKMRACEDGARALGRKVGAAVQLSVGGFPSKTCRLGRGVSSYQVVSYQSSRLIITVMGRNVGKHIFNRQNFREVTAPNDVL